jgi:spermidine synthase
MTRGRARLAPRARQDGRMDAVEYVEVARATSERGEVVLRERRDADAPEGSTTVLELRVNGVFVMDNCETSSEVALAEAALAVVAEPRAVLVGGLGLGFTVHEVLADHRVEHVVVAELEEALVQWFRDGTVPHGQAFLADERLSVAVGDVRQVVAEAGPDSFDLVLLDVDNGPGFLVHQGNAEIYRPDFLGAVRGCLRPDGVVAVWSSAVSPQLEQAVREVFGSCTTQECPVVLQGRDDIYFLYTGQRRGDEG